MSMMPSSGLEAIIQGYASDGGLPPPPPDPSAINVTIGTSTIKTTTNRLGWTSVHSQDRGGTTKAKLATAAYVQNQHLIGFGSNVDPQPGDGSPYNWSFMDSTFGFPTSATGYFSVAQERCLTICGAPPHMRSPKVPGQWDPTGVRSGAQLTSLSEYIPPNSSWFQEYANLAAAFALRYPHVKYFQVWNEMKGFYIASPYGGASIVPAGSGLPQQSGGTSNRWWMEGYTAMYNKIYTAIKTVRPDAVIVGPYCVLNGFNWDQSSDWADDAFPYDYQGAWGYGDKKVLSLLEYFIRCCTGCDALCYDYRNQTKDSGSPVYYNPASVPASPAPSNIWITNPDHGNHARLWLMGQTYGAWDQAGQRLVDFQAWLRALGASGSQYQRSVCDARTIKHCIAEWYAYPNKYQFYAANPHTGLYYTEGPSTHAEECSVFAWQYIDCCLLDIEYSMCWKPQGTLQGNVVDYGDSNPLALWNQGGVGPSPLANTELKAVCDELVVRFPPNTALKALTFNSLANVWGMASGTNLVLVSRDSIVTNLQVVDPPFGKQYDISLAPYEVRFITR